MSFVGPHQIHALDADAEYAPVDDSLTLAVSVNNAIDAAVAPLKQSLTGLGPSWAPFRSISATADLNTYRTPGVARIRSVDTGSILNLPPGMRSAGHIENIITGDGTDTFWTQRITEQSVGARFWWRTSTDLTGGWSEWQKAFHDATPVNEWHVFLAVGQSNMSGRGIVDSIGRGRYYSSRIRQFGFTRRVLETATVPLDMHDTSTGLSPATVFAENYLRTQPDNVGVLIIPAAHGGTGFTSSTTTHTWTPNVATNPLFDLPGSAVKQAKDGIAALKATGALVSLKAILWHQGENNSSFSTASYAAAQDNLTAYFRTELGDPKLAFLVGQMVPESIAEVAGRPNIDAAHQQTPGRVPYTGFAAATVNGFNPGDTVHMSKIGVDYLGRTYLEAYHRALRNTGNVIKWSQTVGRTAYAVNTVSGLDQLIYGDTGWREVNSQMLNGWTANQLQVRRMGNQVFIKARALNGAAATAKGIVSLPAGFYEPSSTATIAVDGSAAVEVIVNFQGEIQLPAFGRTYFPSTFYSISFSPVPVSTPWPSVLPGTAVGSIPA